MVEKSWSKPVEGTAMKVSFLKLKRLKHVLRGFNKRCYGDLSEKVQDKRKELEAAQLELDTKNNRSTIEVLVTKSGGRVESQAELTEEIVGYFKRILGTFDTAVVVPSGGLLQELYQCSLTSDDQEVIGNRIERREVKNAMFAQKAYFLKTRNIVGDDVTAAVLEFFQVNNLLPAFNSTLVALVPKKLNSSCMKDFRPISCCSVIYKCITRILIDRMTSFLPKLNAGNQSAVIHGRSVSDNSLLAQEMVRVWQEITVT
ncbi:uncharacterized protein LOC105766841 [Gossypium raimondii]|uniref:uncharacterized protein LOC105766841 n=1 Tax=Gossypium raimondii TaxID=29730 RepID=UPI00063AAAA3|nr:uncharacterized protein LOC105766841 [Gossypium raimondii]